MQELYINYCQIDQGNGRVAVLGTWKVDKILKMIKDKKARLQKDVLNKNKNFKLEPQESWKFPISMVQKVLR